MAVPIRKSANAAALIPVITVLGAILYACLAYFFLLLPMIGPLLAGGSLDVERQKQVVNQMKAESAALVAALDDYRLNVHPELRERIAAIVPADKDIPGLFVQMDAIAARHAMVLLSIDMVTDEKMTTSAGDKTVTVSANVGGADFKEFKSYLADVERSLRLFDVQSIVFTPTRGEPGAAADESKKGTYSLTFRAYFAEP